MSEAPPMLRVEARREPAPNRQGSDHHRDRPARSRKLSTLRKAVGIPAQGTAACFGPNARPWDNKNPIFFCEDQKYVVEWFCL